MRNFKDACASGHSQTKSKRKYPTQTQCKSQPFHTKGGMSRNRHTKRQATICSSASSADQTSRANAIDKLLFSLNLAVFRGKKTPMCKALHHQYTNIDQAAHLAPMPSVTRCRACQLFHFGNWSSLVAGVTSAPTTLMERLGTLL